MNARLIVRQRPDVVDQAPQLRRFYPVTFGRHLALTILDDVKEFSVSHALQGRGISIVFELELLIDGHLTFAIAVRSVAHRAVVTIIFLSLCDGLRSRLDRIDLMRSVGGNRIGT